MRIGLILLLLLSVSCATKKVVVERKMAAISKVEKPAVFDPKQSWVNIFPAVVESDGLWYFFYVQLKDTEGKYIDCDPSEIALKTTSGKDIAFGFQRSFVGRYYLTLEKTALITSAEMDFFVKGKALKEQFKLNLGHPDKAHTKITILKHEQNKITFRLRLADKANQPVDLPEHPEVLMDGQGSIEDMKHVKEGVWEFSLIYPEENQIMYFSVRAQGVYLSNIFRYQHVEK
jgi:hypothetical protein